MPRPAAPAAPTRRHGGRHDALVQPIGVVDAILILVRVSAAACTAGQGAVSSTPGSTTRASATVAKTAVPSPMATPAATLAVLPEGDTVALAPGRYAFPRRGTNPEISFTVPAGWAGGSTLVAKAYGDNGPAAPFLWDWDFDHGFKNPCTDHTPVLPAAGSGAAGLLGVIASQPGIEAGPIADVTLGGPPGSPSTTPSPRIRQPAETGRTASGSGAAARRR